MPKQRSYCSGLGAGCRAGTLSSAFMTSKMSSRPPFFAFSTTAFVKCGSCRSGLPLFVMAWTLICDSSIASSAMTPSLASQPAPLSHPT